MKHTPNQNPNARSSEGFALVVIAALFLAFSVVAAAIISRGNDTRQMTRQQQAAEQLSRLSQALIAWAEANNDRFPCPARLDKAAAGVAYSGTETGPDPEFGKPVDYCYAGSPTGIDVLSSGSADNVRGVVPVRILADYGIDVNDALDPWGGRIIYIVNRNITPMGDGIPLNTERATINIMASGTQAANPDTYSADFILISYGRDGLGGYQRAATSVSIPCPSDSTARSENCDDDITFIVRPPYTHANASVSTYFDDILSYYRQSN